LLEGGQALPLVVDGELAIQVVADFDTGSGVGAASGALWYGKDMACERDSVVAGDGSSVLEAEEVGSMQAGRPTSVSGARLCGFPSEAAVEVGEEALEGMVRLLKGGGIGFPEGFDQPILEGAEQALHPSLSLRGVGWDELDVQLIEQPSELAAGQCSGQLLLYGGLFGALEDGVAIGVDGHGKAVGAADGLKQQHVSRGVFLLSEDRSHHLAGCVIYGRKEAQTGTSLLQPLMVAAIHLQEHSRLRVALSSHSVAGGTAFAGAWEPLGAADAAHGRT